MEKIENILKKIVEICKENGVDFDKVYYKVNDRGGEVFHDVNGKEYGKTYDLYFEYEGKVFGGAIYFADIDIELLPEKYAENILRVLKK